ncbi:HypC/HybG/HupF family hydrogenase formation chaperone [Tepidibacter hydrothermalis]|uniref:HypC/HybG/HupF family hydrogenase formation chaperone n=1 Tax=Tepidibacter hydrothermalis TaxID=3036126 RepID=A0ABY8EHM2_9FIRM|nr:HypC/HybG/HupF family hydrogenase formation chaperone [Tepidibacter hydrothermalis]WFD12256.1 HypC/HybG/HupF family hydrogenase formation chaperone [Tepidibacter hydrothermalis]
MCVAVPAEVIEIKENEALVNFGGVKKTVNINLVDDLKIGDYVLLHAGCAMQKVDKEEAEKTLEIFRLLSEND